MTDKYSGQVVFTQMETRQKGEWNENRSNTHNMIQKRRLRNIAISTAAVFCLGIGTLHFAVHQEEVTKVMAHVTTDFEYDETLGRLQFVSNILPESAMVFLESEPADIGVFSPVNAEIAHGWSQQEPWLEYESEGSVAACSDGDVMTVVKNRADAYTVRIIHENGYESIYSGLSDVSVEPYDKVLAGDLLGNSNGVAAFEMRKDGMSIEPAFQVTTDY